MLGPGCHWIRAWGFLCEILGEGTRLGSWQRGGGGPFVTTGKPGKSQDGGNSPRVQGGKQWVGMGSELESRGLWPAGLGRPSPSL